MLTRPLCLVGETTDVRRPNVGGSPPAQGAAQERDMRKLAKNELKTTARCLAGLVAGGMLLAGASAAHAGTTTTTDPNLDCLANTTATFSASPSTIVLGQSTTLSWNVKVPVGCSAV